MKYKQKGEQKLDREAIAQELTRLAGLIADGDVGTLEQEIPLEDQGTIKWEHKVKNGRFTSEIRIEIALKTEVEDLETRFSAGPASEEDSDEERPQRQGGQAGRKRRRRKSAKGKNGRPYKAKKIKKAMNPLWKELSKAAKSGQAFGQENAVKLFDLINQYGQLADPAWKDQWLECAKAMKEAAGAVKAGKYEQALEAVDRANRLTKACHKQYK